MCKCIFGWLFSHKKNFDHFSQLTITPSNTPPITPPNTSPNPVAYPIDVNQERSDVDSSDSSRPKKRSPLATSQSPHR